MEGPRAWWGGGLAQHAGHTEAVLQQRQLKDSSQTGGREGEERNKVGGGKEEKGERSRAVNMRIERKKDRVQSKKNSWT